MAARITNFGGVAVNLIAPDRHGKPINVVLGYDDLASYEKGGVYSAQIGLRKPGRFGGLKVHG